MVNLEGLRRFAEFNLCPECYQKYVSLIEPSIKEWLSKPLSDWTSTESYITMLTMRQFGALKPNDQGIIGITADEVEDYPDIIDKNKYDKMRYWSFKQKIDYLKKEKVLKENTHALIERARQARNKAAHNEYYELTEQDLLF